MLSKTYEVVERIQIENIPRQTCLGVGLIDSFDEACRHADRCQRAMWNDSDYSILTYAVRLTGTDLVLYETSAVAAAAQRIFNRPVQRLADKSSEFIRFEYLAMVDPYMDELDVEGFPKADEEAD